MQKSWYMAKLLILSELLPFLSYNLETENKQENSYEHIFSLLWEAIIIKPITVCKMARHLALILWQTDRVQNA